MNGTIQENEKPISLMESVIHCLVGAWLLYCLSQMGSTSLIIAAVIGAAAFLSFLDLSTLVDRGFQIMQKPAAFLCLGSGWFLIIYDAVADTWQALILLTTLAWLMAIVQKAPR